jgi:hypothetical protein
VFGALAVSHWPEHQTGWSIKKFVRTARRYRTVQIKAGRQTLTAADPLPDDLRDALATINTPDRAHELVGSQVRHTYASLARSAGADMKLLQVTMGRASIMVTAHTYADLYDSDLDRVADALDGLGA